jgi:putative tryptophan/tyrosine transport system substrate-binding protein
VRRRELLIGGAASVAVLCACERLMPSQSRMATIGFLSNVSAAQSRFAEGFVDGLREQGLVEGQNLKIEWRWADGRNELLPSMAADLVALDVQVLVTTGGTVPPIARRATDRIPIVSIGDPVPMGLADSYARPGGNVTGVTEFASALTTKVLEALVAIVPGAHRLANLTNLTVGAPSSRDAFFVDAERLGLEVLTLDIQRASDLEPAFERAAAWGADILHALNVVPLNVPRELVPKLALQWRIPSGSAAREWVEAGSLLAYNTPGRFLGNRAAWYVVRIMNGANPAELPVERPMVFDVVLNRTTLAYFGLALPPHVTAQVTHWVG